MIQDKDTNIVYISKWLRNEHPQFFEEFITLLNTVGIHWDFLKYTNDFWARDYMPIQIENDVFVKYRYYPDYLLKTQAEKDSITNCSRACKCLGISYKETQLVIDGGNVVPCGDYIVMTNKLFSENKKNDGDKTLIDELEKAFGHKVIIIPWHKTKDDEYGHADGLIKYAGGKRILMGNHRESHPEEADAMRNELECHGFEVTELRYNVRRPNEDYNWAYINFLQVGDNIIMPTFGIAEDAQAREQIQAAFPNCEVYGIRANEIADEGGALHCLTWNIKL